MSSIAIRVDNLSKAYRIGLKEQQHETLLGAAAAWIKSPFANFRNVRNLSRFENAVNQTQVSASSPPPQSDVFWALRDVSFEVKRGEAIGIIGRNGAGKSTLLKILSRITEPTSGRAEIYGRVGSLLEVGTGFHPDLTGRENVYLNGTILGMKKREIDRRFDEIVEFSGVEQFIDTPVKRYSSGMRVRLAFSVAAHLEPEILIVDEVLAVGDADFQKKCLGKMEDVASQGRTVLFVSHNMGAIARMCSRALSLNAGQIQADGDPSQVVQAYLSGSQVEHSEAGFLRIKHGPFQFSKANVQQAGIHDCKILDASMPFVFEIDYLLTETVTALLLGFDIVDAEENLLFRTYDLEAFGLGVRPPGAYRSKCVVPGGLLQPSVHHLSVLVGLHRKTWLSRHDLRIRLDLNGPSDGDVDYPGLIKPMVHWEVKTVG